MKPCFLILLLAALLSGCISEKRMSQGDICRATGMDRGYISRVESGQKNPTISNLEKIAVALKISPDELLKNN